MKKLFYLLFFFSVVVNAQESALFEEGNTAYSEGNYEQAIERYNSILEDGKTDVAVHYNLANAHYKLNHIAPSIYHYEKALQLAPNDEDVRNNIVFAQNMAIDAIEETPQSQFSGWMESGYALFSVSGWGWTAVTFVVLFAAFFLVYYFSSKPVLKRAFFIAAVFFFVLAIGSVFMGYSRQSFEESQEYAIIFSEEAEVLSEPNVRGAEVFVLHEGTKVQVVEDFQQWSKIELANGNQGWILQDTFRRL
ncbi:tetratricopeptide repeat protein [Salinimicrobium sp. GXAS 041]|uniref:tetratricopeptide repeat protein n=1 Tax=Salinimicrobium sp. GXAS 041 TaxID=3400806 RepID=UPI003C753FBF